jgi:hypothetical protein
MKDVFTENLERIKREIKRLEHKVEVFESIKELRIYLLATGLNRNSFLVELRRQVILDLEAQGLNKFDISKILNKNHATILHALKSPADPEIEKVVKSNYKQWIADRVFPESVSVTVVSADHPSGFRSKVDYKLLKVRDEYYR